MKWISVIVYLDDLFANGGIDGASQHELIERVDYGQFVALAGQAFVQLGT